MTGSTPPAADRLGHVEHTGIEYIPENRRDSSPRNVFAVLTAGNFAWTVVIFGWLPVALGLDFWSSLSSSVIGTAIGSTVMMPVALIGPRAGTNMTVASSAFFGIRGRLIGSALSLVFAVVFQALNVWTSGDAIVAAAHRLFGTPDGTWPKSISYAVVATGVVVVALYGHATIVALQKVLIPISGALLALGVFAYAPRFHVHVTTTTDYALGGYWQTWTLSLILGLAGPITYVTFIGDYTRRIPLHGHRDLRVASAVGGGLFIGNILPFALGIFVAVTIVDPTNSFIDDLVAASPGWYVAPIIGIAVLGGISQGVINIYASGLDLEGLIPRLSRVQTTTVTAIISTALIYVAVFWANIVDALTALTLVLNGIAVPWATIMIIGAIRNRRCQYHTVDLQAFAQRRHGGTYWFTAGWNIPAVTAWLAGSIIGVLAVNCPLYVGPFANLAGGIDLSTVGSGGITAIVYLIMLRLRPDPYPTPSLPSWRRLLQADHQDVPARKGAPR